jgi:hypothetical protein
MTSSAVTRFDVLVCPNNIVMKWQQRWNLAGKQETPVTLLVAAAAGMQAEQQMRVAGAAHLHIKCLNSPAGGKHAPRRQRQQREPT